MKKEEAGYGNYDGISQAIAYELNLGRPNKDHAKVAICVASRDNWKNQFGRSLFFAGMNALHVPCGYDHISFSEMTYQSSIIAASRQHMVKEALQNFPDVTHILFIDDDMEIPAGTISLMLLRDKDIVAANCARKSVPSNSTARKDNKEVYTRKSSVGLEEVDMVGTAVMMIKIDVFKKLRLPWFATPYYDLNTSRTWSKHRENLPEDLVDALENAYFMGGGTERNGFVGEDIFFCNKAKGAGYKIYIDHDLSKGVSHIGDFPYKHEQMEGWDDKENRKERRAKESRKRNGRLQESHASA